MVAKWEIDRLNYIKEKPQDFIDHWMKYSYARLGQKLDMIREQKQMAFDQKNDLSFKYLAAIEDIICECRIRKGDAMDWNKPEKKAIKKRNKKVKEIFNAPAEKEEIESQDSETDNSYKERRQQLSFDF